MILLFHCFENIVEKKEFNEILDKNHMFGKVIN